MGSEVLLVPIVAIAGSFIMVVAVVYLGARAKERTARYRADVQMKMIERFGSANEFTQFLESPAGRSFLQDSPRRSARDRVTGSIRTGIIMTFIGLGFGVAYFAEHDPGWFIPASIMIALGLGFLISAAVSWRMVKTLDNPQQPPAVS